MPTVAEAAVQIALDESKRGVFETNNDNRGPRVDEYQMFANGTLGQAWCAKFAYWCFAQAALQIRGQNPFPKIFMAGAVEEWAKFNGKTVAEPVLGDVFVRASKSGKHVGIATGSKFPNGMFSSVEGNTWANTTEANRREGVYVLKNEIAAKCTFIRLC
jgi:hypothetical protein